MEPINYNLNVQQPFQAALQGYQAGAAIRNDQQQQAAQQAALKLQQQKQALLSGLATKQNPTADDYASVITQLPELSEHLNRAWSLRNTAQQESHASDLLKWGAAIKSGQPKVAAEQMIKRADLMEAQTGAPTEESKALRANAQVLEASPQLALGQIQAMLAANPLGKQAADALASFGNEQRAGEQAPSDLRAKVAGADKAEADASTAKTTAKFAESKAVMDLKMSDEQIKKWAADTDIARQNSRIAAMNAAISRESNDLKRQELGLKVQEAISARDDKLRGKVADVEAARGNIDNMLNTVDRVLGNKSLNDVLGSFEGRMPNMASALDDEESDAIALIETLGSQAFLSQLPNIKGLGQLSNSEGDKLQAALQNLGRAQSEKQFRASAKEAQRIMMIARKNIANRYGVPDNVPDTPAVKPSAQEVDDLVRKYGGG